MELDPYLVLTHTHINLEWVINLNIKAEPGAPGWLSCLSPTLDFGSGHDLRVMRSSPVSNQALCQPPRSVRSLLEILYLWPFPCAHTLYQINLEKEKS